MKENFFKRRYILNKSKLVKQLSSSVVIAVTLLGATGNLPVAINQLSAKTVSAESAKRKEIRQQYEAAKAEYDKKLAEHEKKVKEITAENAKISENNKKLQEVYNAALATTQEFNNYLKTEKEKAKAEFPNKPITETAKEVKVDPTSIKSYQDYKKAVEALKVQNQKAIDAFRKAAILEDKAISDAQEYNAQVRKRNQEGQARVDAENKEGQAAVDKKNREGQAKVDAQNAEINSYNEQATRFNQAEQVRFEEEKAEADANTQKEGYASQTVVKHLLFGKENTTKARLVSVTGVNYASISKVEALPGDWTAWLRQDWANLLTTNVNEARKPSGQTYAQIPANGRAVARYEGLDASYDGRKIVAAEFIYRPKNNKAVNAFFDADPAKTISIGNWKTNEDVEVDMEIRFYDDKGKEVLPTEDKPFVYSVASMNSYGEGSGHIEFVRLPSDNSSRFIPINGSHVEQTGKLLYAKRPLDGGNVGNWDYYGSPLFYKGAGIVLDDNKVTTDKRIKFSFGVMTNGQNGTPSEWFAFNTDFATSVVTPPQRRELKENVTFTPETFTPKTFTPEKEKEVPVAKASLALSTINAVPEYKPTPEKELPTPPTAPEEPNEDVDDEELYTTNWVDDSEQANKLKDSVTGEKPLEAGTIENWSFVRTDVSQDGYTITHVFTQPPKEEVKVKTRHIDIDTKVVMREDEGTTGSTYFENYKFVKTEKEDNGDTNHYYRKNKTRHVTIENGKEKILREEEGEKPKSSFEGYAYEKTIVEENGDIKHFYVVPPKPVEIPKIPEPKTPVQTGAGAGKFVLPVVGVIGLSGLVGGLAWFKSKRKK